MVTAGAAEPIAIEEPQPRFVAATTIEPQPSRVVAATSIPARGRAAISSGGPAAAASSGLRPPSEQPAGGSGMRRRPPSGLHPGLGVARPRQRWSLATQTVSGRIATQFRRLPRLARPSTRGHR